MAADSTQFLIDIATRLTGGTAAASTLADLGDKMTAAGASAAQLDAAVSAAKEAVEASGAAAAAAAAAVSDGAARYAEAESAADKAAKAVERIAAAASAQRDKIQEAMDLGDLKGADRAEAKLAQLNDRFDEAVDKAYAAKDALAAEGEALDKLKADASAATEEHDALAASLDNLESAAGDAAKAEKKAADAAAGSGKVNEMSEALGKLGGPLGHLGQKVLGAVDGMKKLGGSMGSAVGMAAAATVAVAALVVGIIAGTAAIVSWAVGLADAARTSSLLSAGIAGTVEGGKALDATISKLANKVPIAADELQKMAADLAKGGKKGQELTDALEEAAVKAAKLKYGPEYAKQLLSLDNQAAKLKRSLQGTFGGLNIEGALGGLDLIGSLLDSNTESGKALKLLFEAVFQPIVDGVAAAAPSIEAFALWVEINMLKAYIAIKQNEIYWRALEATLWTVAIVVGVLAAAVAVLVALFAISVAVLAAPFVALVMAVIYAYDLIAAIDWSAAVDDIVAAFDWVVDGVVGAWNTVVGAIQSAIDWLSGLDLGQIGSDLISGLVNGILGSAGAIIDAITGAVGGAIDAATSLLKINSPSKVFEAIGASTGEGFVGGVDDGAPDAAAAMEDMVTPPTVTASAPASGGGSIVVNLSVVINGRGQDDDGLVVKIEDAFTRALEGVAMQLGAAHA